MNKVRIQIVMTVYVLLGTFGILFSFSDTFQIEYEKEKICLIVGLFCVLMTGVLCRKTKRSKLIAAGITVIGAGAAVVLYGEQFRNSWNYIWSKVSILVEDYLGITVNVSSHYGTENADKGLIVLFFVIGSVFVYSIVCCKHVWGEMILLGIGFLLPFSLGKVPENITVVIIAITMIGIVSFKSSMHLQEGKRKTGFVGIGIGVAAFLIGMVFPGPQLKRVFQEPEKLQSSIQDFWEENLLDKIKGKSGVSAGVIGGVGNFGEDNSEQLRLTVKERPKTDLYLKGYIGVEYENNRWKKASAGAFQSWARSQDTSAGEVLSPLLSKGQEVLHVENIGANPKYRYMPYGGVYGDDLNVQGDTYIQGGLKKSYDVTYFPGYFASAQTGGGEYDHYVSKEYCDVPEHIQKSFGDVVKKKVPEKNVFSVMESVAQLLDKNAAYSLSPGLTPRGQDVAEYFFFENKKGYCEHFATTAVLLFRMKGIPARYVAGYLVSSNDFHKNADGMYEAIVTGDSAHAWAEVYVQGKGWIPAETTPSYSGNQNFREEDIPQSENNSPVGETEEPNETEPQDKPQNEPEEQPNIPVNPTEPDEEEAKIGQASGPTKIYVERRGQGRTCLNPVGAILVIVILIAAVFVSRNAWLRKKRRAERRTGINERTKIVFGKIYQLLVLGKVVKKEQEVNGDLIQKLCEACPKVDKADADQMLEIIYCAAFGNEKIQKEEFKVCQKIYRQVKAGVSENISPWRKFWWKYWRGIPL